MRSNKPWLVAIAFLLVFGLSASSALATTYVKGYVRPSGDGGSCPLPTPPDAIVTPSNCIQSVGSFSTTVIFDGTSSVPLPYDVIEFLAPGQTPNPGNVVNGTYGIDALALDSLASGIVPGDILTFVFGTNPVPDPSTSGVTFGILGCKGTVPGSSTGGIFDSSNNTVTTNCTNVDDVGTLVGDGTGVGDKVSFTFNSGVTIPGQLAFSFPNGDLPSEIDVTAGTVPVSTPEPASWSMLAAGLIGLGVIRRRWAV